MFSEKGNANIIVLKLETWNFNIYYAWI